MRSWNQQMFGSLPSKKMNRGWSDVDATVRMSQLSSALWHDMVASYWRGHVTRRDMRHARTKGRAAAVAAPVKTPAYAPAFLPIPPCLSFLLLLLFPLGSCPLLPPSWRSTRSQSPSLRPSLPCPDTNLSTYQLKGSADSEFIPPFCPHPIFTPEWNVTGARPSSFCHFNSCVCSLVSLLCGLNWDGLWKPRMAFAVVSRDTSDHVIGRWRTAAGTRLRVCVCVLMSTQRLRFPWLMGATGGAWLLLT